MKRVIPISEVCEAQQLAYDQKLTISTGQSLFAKAGDWLVRNSADDFFLVPDHLFRRTYEILAEDTPVCMCAPDASCKGDRNHQSHRPAAWEEPETPR